MVGGNLGPDSRGCQCLKLESKYFGQNMHEKHHLESGVLHIAGGTSVEPIAEQTSGYQIALTKPPLTTKTTGYQTNKCKVHVHFTDTLSVVLLDNLALINQFEIRLLVLRRTKSIGEKEETTGNSK